MKLVQIDKESPQKAQKEMRLPVQYCNNYQNINVTLNTILNKSNKK